MHLRYKNYPAYYDDVRQALFQLNRPEKFNQSDCLANLRSCDENFIKSLNENAKLKSVFFTRHGQCSSSHKGFGFVPNAALEDSALPFLEKAGLITKHLFSENTKLQIAISPMIRPLQTASYLIPDQFTDSIEVVNFFTENSSYPSGKPIFNAKSLAQESGFMFYAASFFYNDENYFNELSKRCDEAKQKICGKLKQEKNNLATLREDVSGNFNFSDQEKITLIDGYIETCGNGEDIDIWFIGHGKNTQNYYNKFGIQDSLDYCETRKIIHFQNEMGDTQEFLTPYILSIDQSSGLFKGMIMQSKELVLQQAQASKNNLELK
jgi:hypothetical protein